MSKIEKNHEIVGKKIDEIHNLDIGTLYPVLDWERETVIGVFSAEFGTPEGYYLDKYLQSYCPRYWQEVAVSPAAGGFGAYQGGCRDSGDRWEDPQDLAAVIESQGYEEIESPDWPTIYNAPDRIFHRRVDEIDEYVGIEEKR